MPRGAPVQVAPSTPASARPDAEEPPKPPRELSAGEVPTPKIHWAYWAALGAVALLALVLRLRDPLSSDIMGAEDPYRHMERTWDLMQGNAPTDYPPGLMFLLMPFALMGQGTFYDVARFLPVLFGVALAVMTFLLCRKHMHPLGAAAAALLVAVMPETIRRSNVLFPTAIDLALIPLLFGLLIHAAYGGRRPVIHLAILGVVFMLVHPWVLGLIVPVAIVYWVGALWTQESRWRMPVTGGAAAGGFLLIVSAASWDFPSMIGDKALPRFGEVLADPGSITPLPLYVDLPAMLGWPALALGAVGAVLTLMKPTKLGMLSLTWCLLLLPLILVDWFDMWYVPHRTVAYFAVGLAMLAGVAISEVVSFLPKDNPRKTGVGMLVVGAALMMLTIPTATAVEPWYRLYEDDDLKAWEELDEDDTEFVQAGSWQARMGYRALTGRDAMYNPGFFTDENTRNFELDKEPDTVVIIDRYAREANVPTDFLDEGWHVIGTWGNTTAYARD